MKSDVLTLAAVVFVVGVVISSLGVSELFKPEEVVAPPSALQLGSQENYIKTKK